MKQKTKFDSSIYTIDCEYVESGVAAAYLIQEGDRLCFIENNTNYAIPKLLAKVSDLGLSLDNVDYCMITHVHLDHAGGSGLLMQHCKNASLLAHPKAARHIIHPTRLIESSKTVYGEDVFKQLYGDIIPVPESRVRIMQDEEILAWGNRRFTFLYTRGHANHHFCIYESFSKVIFTGDAFGIAYPSIGDEDHRFIFPTTTPTDYDVKEAYKSLDKIVNTGADFACLTHFGAVDNLSELKKDLVYGYKEMQKIAEASLTLKDQEAMQSYCEIQIRKFLYDFAETKEVSLSIKQKNFLENDIRLNASGLAFWANREKERV
ncbi:MAG: MBL fold hydrolase [Leptospira sp.]|nr:MAG: MBL fold hydrolase [Leptospira sp.]